MNASFTFFTHTKNAYIPNHNDNYWFDSNLIVRGAQQKSTSTTCMWKWSNIMCAPRRCGENNRTTSISSWVYCNNERGGGGGSGEVEDAVGLGTFEYWERERPWIIKDSPFAVVFFLRLISKKQICSVE